MKHSFVCFPATQKQPCDHGFDHILTNSQSGGRNDKGQAQQALNS